MSQINMCYFCVVCVMVCDMWRGMSLSISYEFGQSFLPLREGQAVPRGPEKAQPPPHVFE